MFVTTWVCEFMKPKYKLGISDENLSQYQNSNVSCQCKTHIEFKDLEKMYTISIFYTDYILK